VNLRHAVAIIALLVAASLAARAAAQACPECLNPTSVTVGNTPFAGSATGCSVEIETDRCSGPSFNTRFFSFTAPESRAYRISTCLAASGNTLTLLAVWAGCEVTEVMACGVAGCPSGGVEGSLIGSVDLQAGTTYRISIGAYCCTDDFIASGILSIDPIDPPGTGCATATTAVVGLNPFDTSLRNEIVDLEGACDPLPQGGTWDDRLWNVQYFRFTPPATGVYSFSTCEQGEQVWERLAVLAGCTTASGVLACSDSTCFSEIDYTGARIVGASLSAGVQYYVLVGGVQAGQSGAGALRIAPFAPCVQPPPTVQEVEPCGGDLNAGCNAPDRPAQPIAVGDQVRGTTWADDEARDTDWYVVDLARGTELRLALHSDIPAYATIVSEDCTSSIFADQTMGLCPGVTDGKCLPAGRYYVVVAPYDYWNFGCGYPAGNSYTLTVTGTPCDASPPPNDRCADATAVTLGSTPFDNYFAGTDVTVPTCNLIGRDVWFSFTAAQAGDHVFSTCNGTNPFNSGMDLWTDCPQSGGEVIACNQDSGDQSCGNPAFSSVVLPMTAGQTVLVRVGSEWLFDLLPPGDAELVVEFVGSQLVCGDPDAGDCCVARSQPFCTVMDCCNSVCGMDPTCCAESWDELCAASASLYCFAACGTTPSNDECSDARPAVAGANAFRNNRAQGSIQASCGTVHSDVWFAYTATGSQAVSISFCAADGGWAYVTGGMSGTLDTMIAVFESCGGAPVACSNDACSTQSKVTFTPTCGRTYLIAVGSRTDAEGIYSQGIGSFTIVQGGSCGTSCPADLNSDGAVNGDDLGVMLGAWGPCPSGGACLPDLNADGAVNGDDLGALLGDWGSCAGG
jgi:hypothetical protein